MLDWSCLSDIYHMASLLHLPFLFLSLSITFAPSHSMMQLFLSALSVIADLRSTVADCLLFTGKPSGCYGLVVIVMAAETLIK